MQTTDNEKPEIRLIRNKIYILGVKIEDREIAYRTANALRIEYRRSVVVRKDDAGQYELWLKLVSSKPAKYPYYFKIGMTISDFRNFIRIQNKWKMNNLTMADVISRMINELSVKGGK